MIGRVIKPIVHIEGVGVSAYSVTVQTPIGGPATAIIDIPPAEEFFDRHVEDPPGSGNFVRRLGVQPRTLVHVFYEDSEDPDGEPRLLFEGEFISYEYRKERNRRVIRITAKDISNILSSIYVRFYSDFFTPYNSLMSIFTGQATADRPNRSNLRLALIGQTGVNPEILEALQKDEEGFGVARAFRDIAVSALSINTFFQNFNNRTKVIDKIVTLTDINSRLLLQATQLASLIQQNMSNLKESSTVWDLYTMLMSLVFYYPVPVTAAPFLPGRVTETVNPSAQFNTGGGTFEVSPGNTLMSLLIKPQTWFTAPPNFNVIFPSQYKTFNQVRNFMVEPTRIMMSAFSVFESLAEEELKRISPSQFLFVAPSPLLERFDREAFDTLAERVDSNPSVRRIEAEIEKLQDQRSREERKVVQSNLTTTERNAARDAANAIGDQIEQKRSELEALFVDIRQEANISVGSDSTKKPRQVSARLWNRNVLTAADDVSLASREDLKGIVFRFDYLTQTQVEVSKAKGIAPEALKEYLANVANYKLALQQSKDRIAEMQLEFSPQLVAGFPTLVVDPVRNFFGEIESVTHVLSAEGLADTQVIVSFLRNDEAEFTELARNEPGNVQFPRWINSSYLPTFIGTNVYQTLFPENRPDKSKPGLQSANSILGFADPSNPTQIGAANRIRKLYYQSRERERFALSFTRRNIASRKQVFEEILSAVKNGDTYVFSSFESERFQAAQSYAAAANRLSLTPPSDAPITVRES